MTDINKTAILVVLDRSGSMSTISKEVIGGFSKFVEDQRKEPGEASLSLVQFDTEYEINYLNRTLAEVPPLEHQPRGFTALNDALGRGIVELGKELASLPEEQRPGKVLVITITDGMENASKEFTKAQLKEMVEEQRSKYGWEFIFMGANVDVLEESAAYGMSAQASIGYNATGAGVKKGLVTASNRTSTYRSTGKL